MPRSRVAFLAATTSLSLSLLIQTPMAQQPTAARSGKPGVLTANLLALVTNPAVQAELKLTEAQKAQLNALGEKDEEQRLRWFERMGIGRPDATGNRGDGKNRAGGDPARQAGRSRPAGQPSGNSNGTGGGRGLDNPPDPEQQDPFAAMLESRLRIQQSTERSIARILSQAQYARARQIQLQVEGPGALLRSDMQERLFLDEDQIAQIRELMQARQRALRETRDARSALRQAALDRDPTLGHLNEQLAQNAPQSRDAVVDRGQQGGRNGRTNRPGNDPAYREARNQAIRKFDEDPENQKQMAAFRAEEKRIEKLFKAALHSKVLTRRQSQAYTKLLGAPFDPTRLPGGANGGRRGGGSGGNPGGTSTAKTPVAGGGDRATTVTSEEEASGQPKSQATAEARRGNLRERRGLGTSDDQR